MLKAHHSLYHSSVSHSHTRQIAALTLPADAVFTMTTKLPAINMRRASRDGYLWWSLLAEFVGMFLFQLLAGVAGDPLETAFAFAGIMYAILYISGGHLNPAVSLAATLSGHIDYVRGFSYIAAQFLGAITGALFQGMMSPDSALGKTGPGCFAPISELNNWSLFLWETVMTFLFIITMYAAIFIRPGHGDAAPLAAAVALFAALATGGSYTGMSPLNPARTFAGALVFKCYWKWAFVYISGQLTASLLAAAWAWSAFGKGDFYRYPSATAMLRQGLLSGEGVQEPAGVPGTYAPGGHHYAGAITEPQPIPSIPGTTIA